MAKFVFASEINIALAFDKRINKHFNSKKIKIFIQFFDVSGFIGLNIYHY